MAATLSVLAPNTITTAMLVSSTVPETDYAQWVVGTTYAIGDRVIDTTTHRVYESAKASNLGKNPTDINNRIGSTIWWIDVTATNRWKLFDTQISTQTKITATSMSYVLKPGAVNAVYLAGLDADTATVSMKDATGGSVVYTKTVTLEDSAPPDYYEYFFAPFHIQEDALFSGLPAYSNPEVTITLAKTSGDILCGAALLGDLKQLGDSLKGAQAKPKTYSYIKINEAGENEIKRRKSAKDMQVSALIPIAQADTVIGIVTSLLDVPAMWIASDSTNYAGLRAFGLGSATVTYDDAMFVNFNLNVNGLI